jgi:hypothetical protein
MDVFYAPMGQRKWPLDNSNSLSGIVAIACEVLEMWHKRILYGIWFFRSLAAQELQIVPKSK